jgi:hypothetical protein
MRLWKLFVALSAGAALVAASVPSSAAYLPPHGAGAGAKSGSTDKKLEIAIDAGTIVINGKKLTLMFDQKELITLLGKPDREAKLSNTLLTWDDLGVFAYVKPDTPKTHAFAVALGRDPSISFWPKKNFSGKLTVDGAELKADSTIAALNKAKKGELFEKNEFLDNTWSFKEPKGSVYLRKGTKAGDGFVAIEVGVLPD